MTLLKSKKYISSNFGKQVGLFALFAITLFNFNIKFHLSRTELLTLLFVRKERFMKFIVLYKNEKNTQN